MVDPEDKWSFYETGGVYDSSKWMITRNGKIVGSVVRRGSEFWAFLKSSEHIDGNYIGSYTTVPLAIAGIRELVNMQ